MNSDIAPFRLLMSMASPSHTLNKFVALYKSLATVGVGLKKNRWKDTFAALKYFRQKWEGGSQRHALARRHCTSMGCWQFLVSGHCGECMFRLCSRRSNPVIGYQVGNQWQTTLYEHGLLVILSLRPLWGVHVPSLLYLDHRIQSLVTRLVTNGRRHVKLDQGRARQRCIVFGEDPAILMRT